jgi:predicted kinase
LRDSRTERARVTSGSITIISGNPGAGKTTLARALAQDCERGVHLVSDLFYESVARLLDPSLPGSEAQNATIIRAVARAAAAFAEGGYAVFLDGIFGPWFLPVLRAEIPSDTTVSYVILQTDAETAVARVRERQGSGMSPVVLRRSRALVAPADFAAHVIDTQGLGRAAVQELFRAGQGEGRFALWPVRDRAARAS